MTKIRLIYLERYRTSYCGTIVETMICGYEIRDEIGFEDGA